MFKTQEEERKFNSILTAYEQEFGADNIIIIFPERLSYILKPSAFKPFTIRTWKNNYIMIKSDKYSANYTQEI